MTILVVGGAGYIGSHMTKLLMESRRDVVVLDDLCTGHRDTVVAAEFVLGNCGDAALVERVLSEYKITEVMHFASHIQVGESVNDPAKYYRNNVGNTLILLESMQKCGVNRFIFSSTAAVYGEPESVPIPEDHPKRPTSPYGRSKLQVEEMLGDFDVAYGLKSVSLRYFNAAGAEPTGTLGERHEPESHLIPLVLWAAAGRISNLQVFGNDYPTADGTGVRDYIHVQDLCKAHLASLDYLQSGGKSEALNLGIGAGHSVLEVIKAAERITGVRIPFKISARRDGDSAVLVADPTKARRVLNWQATCSDLDSIIRSAWNWEQKMGPRSHAHLQRDSA